MTEKDEVLLLIRKALEKVYENDIYLIEKRVSERCIVSKFANYFSQLATGEIQEYNVDVEYNRQEAYTKKIGKRPICVDFIVHKRGNINNLIAIEFKPYWNKNQKAKENDERRIKKLCEPEYGYEYQYGFTIMFGKTLDTTIVKIYDHNIKNLKKIDIF